MPKVIQCGLPVLRPVRGHVYIYSIDLGFEPHDLAKASVLGLWSTVSRFVFILERCVGKFVVNFTRSLQRRGPHKPAVNHNDGDDKRGEASIICILARVWRNLPLAGEPKPESRAGAKGIDYQWSHFRCDQPE